jgi:transcription initiation factor TFIID subunit 13
MCEQIEAVDDVLVEWIQFVASEAARVGDGSKIVVEDVMFVLRKDDRKHARVRELVVRAKQIERDQKEFKSMQAPIGK